MRLLRVTIRLLLLGLHAVVVGGLLCVFILPANWNKTGLSRQRSVIRWWLIVCVRLINIRVQTSGIPVDRAALFVANHISWMDIVIIGSLQPVSFLSKIEISHWPIIGYLARKGGTLFIERGKGAAHAAHLISQRLRVGSNVALFPEGRASDGTRVNKLHARLFMSALEARVPVQPVFITYPCKNAANGINPKAPYLRGGKPFFTNAIALLAEPHTDAIVEYTQPIFEAGTRDQLAQKAWEQIAARHLVTVAGQTDAANETRLQNRKHS